MSVVDLDLSTTSVPVEGAIFFTTESGNAIVVHVRGEVDATDILILTGVLEAALRRSGGALVLDLSAVTSFDVLPLAVLAKYRARIASENGLFRIVVADHPEGPLADLDPRRWNIVTATAEAAATEIPRPCTAKSRFANVLWGWDRIAE
jgi:anti-anti-sigma factor